MTTRTLPSALPSKVALVFIFFIAAAASYGGFFEKWTFRDGSRISAMAIAEGRAPRPFVYRQLLPALAVAAEKAVPASINQRFQAWLTADPKRHNMIHSYFPNAVDSADAPHAVRYYTLYFLTFGCLLAALFGLRALCFRLYGDLPAATLAALGTALLLPLFLTEGGYFYDMAELLFMVSAVWIALYGPVWLLVPLAAVATYNKESFLLFAIALYPFLRERYSRNTALALEILLIAVAVAVNVLVKYQFRDNPGDPAQFQLWSHLAWLLSPRAYLQFEVNYGVPTPKGLNVIHLFLLWWLARNAWPHLSRAMKQHIWIASGISLPLFLAFCYEGELRNFSLLYVGFAAMLCVNVSGMLQRAYRGGETVR